MTTIRFSESEIKQMIQLQAMADEHREVMGEIKFAETQLPILQQEEASAESVLKSFLPSEIAKWGKPFMHNKSRFG